MFLFSGHGYWQRTNRIYRLGAQQAEGCSISCVLLSIIKGRAVQWLISSSGAIVTIWAFFEAQNHFGRLALKPSAVNNNRKLIAMVTGKGSYFVNNKKFQNLAEDLAQPTTRRI